MLLFLKQSKGRLKILTKPVFLFSDDLHLYLNEKGRNLSFFLLYLKPNI